MKTIKFAVVLLVLSILFGCHVLPDGAGYLEPTPYHTRIGISPDMTITQAVKKCGYPMPERYTQPHFRHEVAYDFTGWAWWPASNSTAAGVRYEAGKPVEYAYGFNHWKEFLNSPDHIRTTN